MAQLLQPAALPTGSLLDENLRWAKGQLETPAIGC